MKKLILHFQKYQKMKRWEFLWKISLEFTLLSVLLIPILIFILKFIPGLAFLFDTESIDEKISWVSFIYIVLLVPILETLIFQAFPIFIARLFKAAIKWQILVSMLFFMSIHLLGNSILSGILAGSIGGFYLAFIYSHWRNKSRWDAFEMTVAAHFFHNLVLAFLWFLEPFINI